ncbi:MAG: HEPN domain-containing protein [Candidatus Nezhaarchaeota archaeon]|nr:HEPN domain-containing protein [Candidatus Nezhaarchaeota archaeon]
MNNVEMARSYIRQAEERLHHAREAVERGSYPYTVRQCQEAVEMLLKAALRLVGVEPPKWHDVGPLLARESGSFPEWFQREVKALAKISRRLRREREPSMYGDEETGMPPEEIYDKEDAEEALRQAEHVYAVVVKLFRLHQGGAG